MISVRSYDARNVWTFSGLGDDSDYPGKIRALAAAAADRASIACYRARRFVGLPGILADLITTALCAAFPVLLAVDVAPATPVIPMDWPRVWAPRRVCDRLTSRRTTGPPCSARPMTPGGSLISP